MRFLKFLLTAGLIATATISFCQKIPASLVDGSNIEQLESSLSKKSLLQDVHDSLVVLKNRAIASHNEILQARCLYNLMRIRDMRTEDTLYFRNSAFIDTILTDPSSPAKLKALMYILQAQRLYRFDHRYNKFNAAAYRTKDLANDYAVFNDELRSNLINSDLEAALKLNPFGGDVTDLLWISSNPDVFLFKPKFEDLVLSESVSLAFSRRYDYEDKSKLTASWAALPSPDFRKLLDTLAAGRGKKAVFGAYRRWLDFRKADTPVNMFIESLARKYIFLTAPEDSSGRVAYINYLKESTTSAYAPLRAHAVYQLCLIWNAQGKGYVNFFNRYQFVTGHNFDKRYQYIPKKAFELYEQNKQLMAQYPVLDKVLKLMAKQICSSGIKVEMENKFIPGEDIAIKAIYKNAGTLFYRIVVAGGVDDMARVSLSTLMDKKPVVADKFALPLPDDYNSHAAYLKLSALPKGSYYLLFSHKPITASADSVYTLHFQVTSVTAINTDTRLYVLDRKTGKPLPGATVALYKNLRQVNGDRTEKVNQRGYVMIPQDMADSISIAYKSDTIGQRFNANINTIRDDYNIYDKDEYDDLDDFYDDKLKMEIFTDRAIYRPGQTVHYKIIFLTNDPRTGTAILFSPQNVGSSLFSNRVKKWIKDNQALIKLMDPFNRKVDTARIVINEFGSFAGSFVLPKAAATGQWQIDGDPNTSRDNEGYFQVEEYKRPTIELAMEKQTKMLMPGQPFTIKLKLRSFTGAQLGNIPITYKLERYGELPDQKNSNGIYKEVTLLDTLGRTDKDGVLDITVNDSLLTKYKFEGDHQYNYNYSITANAIDATGEASDISEQVNISTQPIRININIGNIYDRRNIPQFNVKTTNEFEGNLGRLVNIKLYQVSDPDAAWLKQVDEWYYNQSDWNKWFPQLAELATQPQKKRTLVLDTVINTGLYQKLVIPWQKVSAGFYELDAVCADGEKITGKANWHFKVFDSATGETPVEDINYLPFNSANAGDTITWYSSGRQDAYTIYQVLCETIGRHKAIKNVYQELNEKKGVRKWTYAVPADAAGDLLITRVSVYENKLYRQQQTVYLNRIPKDAPEIIIERYRKVMAPGAKETFTVSVKTKNDDVAAELMTTMYDASLDKLKKSEWRLPREENDRLYLRADWNYGVTATVSAGENGQLVPVVRVSDSGGININEVEELLQGRAAGVTVTEGDGLNEVVVVGYGTVRRSDLTGSVTVMIRGSASLQEYQQPLIILDGQIYTGDLKNLAPSTITEAIVLKGADATAIYGSQASQGVLIISTKGPIVLPGAQEPVIKVRKNFNETAFFFPQVHVSTDGYYHINFTMPESATEWKWKMMAHTADARFAYLERTLQTQLNLMVQPNMPRLLYQGDEVKLQSRISNLDTLAVTGTINCKIENVATGEDITTQLVKENTKSFHLEKKSTGAAFFQLTVPRNITDPLKVVISVTGGGASDAEEHIIPVLSTQVFARQSVPVRFGNNTSVTVPAIKLPAGALVYGVGISMQQKPQASLINALPWLANYSYDCAEQTFNKLRAEATALRLMRVDTNAQRAYNNALKNNGAEKAGIDQRPDELPGESMPWLDLSSKTSKQQAQLFKLLDTPATKENIIKRLERLYKLQQDDGGLAWFDGGKSNPYISAYVLAGFGQLQLQNWAPGQSGANSYHDFIVRLFKYGSKMVMDERLRGYDLEQLYALSYWPQYGDASLSAKVSSQLSSAWQDAGKFDLGQQALLIVNTFRLAKNDKVLYQKAQLQLKNIRQQAIEDAENGIRWKDIADAEDLESSSEETVALLDEAFGFDAQYKNISTGIIQWLLSAKQEQHWQTTKATAAAIGIMEKQSGGAFGENQSFAGELAGKKLEVSNGLLEGAPEAFVRTAEQPAPLMLQQQGANAKGALTWYYFSDGSHLDTLNKAIKINRKYYRYDKNHSLIELPADAVLKVGDDIHVKLTIETATQLKFVHIDDPRAAAFEPKDNESGYHYSGGIGYYQSVRDTGLDLFAEVIPRGESTIEYDLTVAMSGSFAGGPVKLQCMYQPSATAYSNSARFVAE